MILKRSIPVLTIDDSDLVKNRQFKSYKYIGDPINAVKIFNEKGVDELIVLDITKGKREPDYNLIQSLTNEAFMPLTYGGGISSIEQMKKIYRMGIEKISINSAAYTNPKLIKEAAAYFGSQSVVCAIDYKKDLFGRYYAYIDNGQKRAKTGLYDLAKEYESLGAGELMLTCIDRESMKCGYDFETLKKIADSVEIPIIVNGGASSRLDLIEAIDNYGASAAAAGSLFILHGVHDAVLITYINLN